MPIAPTLITYDNWLLQTNRKKFMSDKNKTRSDPLENVDLWIQAYERDKSPMNLSFLSEVLNVWLLGKKTNNQGDHKTIRDHQGAVATLKRNVDNAVRLLKPLGWGEQHPGIFIAQDAYRGDCWVPDDFVGDTRIALATIASKPIGKALLEGISAKCDATKRIVIEYTNGGAKAAPVSDLTEEFRAKIQLPLHMGGESGFVKQVMANPDIVVSSLTPNAAKKFVPNAGAGCVIGFNHKDQGDGRPVFIALAHELVHAYHYVHGACYRGIGDSIESGKDAGLMEEEMRTVGFGKYANEVPSENAIRVEHNQTPRASYVPNEAWAEVKRTV